MNAISRYVATVYEGACSNRLLLLYSLLKSLVHRLHSVSTLYHRNISKKKTSDAVDDEGKMLPRDALGVVMIVHGEQLEGSLYGEIRSQAISWSCRLNSPPRIFPGKAWPGPLQGRACPGGLGFDFAELVP